ncbi:MAG: N-acetyltransferase [Phycisphaerales bacterium]|nr:MAG: N-acetyltransferase [Phycisphaerales bacterium]
MAERRWRIKIPGTADMNTRHSNSAQDFSIVRANSQHLDGMVRCHIASFPGQFMTVVGARFIKGFYRFYLRENAVLFVATGSSGIVVGLVCGGEAGLRQKFSRRRAPFYAPDIILGAIKNDRARERLFHHLRSAAKGLLASIARRGRSGKELHDNTAHPPLSLLSICADPDFRGRGVGVALMERFEQESRTLGYKLMRLSVHADNQAAINLYAKCGWERLYEADGGIYFRKRLG